MNEVEKMYENCNFEKSMGVGSPLALRPFTAEKQILLIQWLLDKTDLYLHRHKTDFTYSIASSKIAVNKYKDFKEGIAEFMNVYWQFLTEAEKAQIKNILEG